MRERLKRQFESARPYQKRKEETELVWRALVKSRKGLSGLICPLLRGRSILKCPRCRNYMRFQDIERWESFEGSPDNSGNRDRYETAFFICPACHHPFSQGIVRVVSIDRTGREVEVEERERECPSCGRLMPVQVRICRVCGMPAREFENVQEEAELHGRVGVVVVRCPVDGISYDCGHGSMCDNLIDSSLIGGAHLVRCVMCGDTTCLIGPQGVYHGTCQNCGRQDYVVNYEGSFVCGACLYTLGTEDGVIN